MWSKVSQLTLMGQSLFGLPWILMAVAIAYQDPSIVFPRDLFFWIFFFLAFFTARILGMSLNRMIDFEIDGRNQRTKGRPLQLKIISRNEVKLFIVVCTLLFLLCCYMLSPLCFFLCPLVLFLLYGYSYTKRFSALCHFFLGSIHFFGPIFAWVALTNSMDIRPILLGGGLWLMIAANDMVYAIDDLVFDREEGLKSVPAVFGAEVALWIARGCYALAIFLLVILGLIAGLKPLYFVGVGLVLLIYLCYYFYHINPEKTLQECNILGGMVLLLFTVLSIIWPLSF